MTTYRVKAIRAATAEELAARDRLRQMAANQLPAVRQAADRWRTGAGLSGSAVAVAGILTAPEVLANASALQLQQGLWALGIALGLAIAALGCSLRSSFGWPAVKNIVSADGLREWERIEVRRSITFLRWSMIMALAAVVATAVAGAVLLFSLDALTLQLVPKPAVSPTG